VFDAWISPIYSFAHTTAKTVAYDVCVTRQLQLPFVDHRALCSTVTAVHRPLSALELQCRARKKDLGKMHLGPVNRMLQRSASASRTLALTASLVIMYIHVCAPLCHHRHHSHAERILHAHPARVRRDQRPNRRKPNRRSAYNATLQQFVLPAL
jgi:hypothetical protein